MASPGAARLAALATSPAAPPPNYLILYFKTDGILYIKDSGGVETPIGTASGITSLVGEATASGPGAASVVLSNSAVIGKILTGFTPGPNSTVLASDTLLQAIQKLQAQVTAAGAATLAGDVTGPIGTTVVAFVGGQPAADVAAATTEVEAATAANTASRIVKRDASGDFAARDVSTRNLIASGTVTGTNLSGTNTGDVTVTDSDSIDFSLSGQALSADVRLADGTLVEEAAGIKVGTVPVAQISGFNEAAQDAIGLALTDTESVDLTYDDVTNQIRADVRLADLTLEEEAGGIKVGIVPAAQVSGLDNVATSGDYNDLINTPASLPPSGAAGGDLAGTYPNPTLSSAKDANVKARANHTGTQPASTISDFTEAAQDAIATALSSSDSIDFVYNDIAGIINADLRLSLNAQDPAFVLVENDIQSVASNGLRSQVPAGTPVQIGTSNNAGAANTIARGDHVHAHGNQIGGTLHAIATTLVAGFMSALDKAKLDAATAAATVSTLVFRDASGSFAANEITADLVGDVSGNLTGNVTGNVSGSAGSFTGALVGDVTGTQGATVVSTVGGKTAAAVSTSVDDTVAATALATPSTIAKRDANGDLAFRDVSTRKVSQATVALTDGATINTDAALGNVFTVTIAGNRTMANPTNPTAEQRITFRIRQDAVGSRVLTWASDFNFGVDLAGVPGSTGANAFDYYGFQYNPVTLRWDCLAISRGY